ncbi:MULTISPECIES: hypothetical protein [Aeromonas]|nr:MULTISPECIES: hypothetical protein [Aeromonas]KUE81219.1 hypothetical protein ATO46_13125 [Aeromonas schubertii]MBZ6073471.1 hypothetical protein [Aeromonas schubertii]TNI73307.1 hypothetical protein CF133_21190 [Aeromonas salmonicida]
MKKLFLLLPTLVLTACAGNLTSIDKTSPQGRLVVIGQFPPKPENHCTLKYNEEMSMNLLERYTSAGMVNSVMSNSAESLKTADTHQANYVHIYLPAQKMLFGVIDLNYNDKPRTTYYDCQSLKGLTRT